MTGFRYLDNVVTLEYEKVTCIGSGRCEEVCPHQVFACTDVHQAGLKYQKIKSSIDEILFN
ncbi:MAG: hypothetical protein WCG31_00995 [Deltaproteobacteria bacterium]